MKKIFDSLHGFIHLDDLEYEYLNLPPVQRLSYIMQLGCAFLVYPGVTHRRYEHSLGTMHISSKIYDKLSQEMHTKWLAEANSFEYQYYRKILRLAALSHDLGHLPFSHCAEHAILGDGGHELWTYHILNSDFFDGYWEKLQKELKKQFGAKALSKNPKQDVIKIAIGEKKYQQITKDKKSYNYLERMISEIITADLFGADRIDYLLRDAKYSGLAYGSFDFYQLIENLQISLKKENDPKLIVAKGGLDSCESLLISRYFMHKRLYQYASVKAYAYHMAEFMKYFYHQNQFLQSAKDYIQVNDSHIITDMQKVAQDKKHPLYLHASRLTKQEKRFEALKIPLEVKEDEIKKILKERGFELSSFGFEFIDEEKAKHRVLWSSGPLKNSEIPYKCIDKNWIYTPESIKTEVIKLLSSYGWDVSED